MIDFDGARVLITGGTGSLGHALTAHILNQNPRRLIIFSRDEQKQDEMRRLFSGHENADALRFFVGDVRDVDRLKLAMHGLDSSMASQPLGVVIHAAALKIIPSCEYNPFEAVLTNIVGSQNVVRAAIDCGVSYVLGVSTDKAVSPVNLYGATKLCMERIFLAANALAAGRTKFSCVRYGNVAGSRGSVIPLFKRLAAAGQPLPVTDLEMTRFSITMPQAVDLVCRAIHGLRGRGGEIYIPRLPSFRMRDLITAVYPVPLSSGKRITELVGVRPGEKIHETLITADEMRNVRLADTRLMVVDPAYSSPHPTLPAYSSDTNDQWLTVDELREIVRKL
jgi:UDP-N-acetylglucosamine 4,6-dehydratase/5-epimerase